MLCLSPVSKAQAINIWLDTDIACNTKQHADIDDCLALFYLLRSKQFTLRGISTVFGNLSLNNVNQALSTFESSYTSSYPEDLFPDTFSGAKTRKKRKGGFIKTAASRAISNYFRNHTGVLLAIGPLTNIATALHFHPEIQSNINKLMIVAGTYSESRRFFPGTNRLISFRDFNVAKDRYALAAVFDSQVALYLSGYDAGQGTLLSTEQISQWAIKKPFADYLLPAAQIWQQSWLDNFSIPGFYPFDLVAAKALSPTSNCSTTKAELRRRYVLGLHVLHSLRIGVGERTVMTCE